jgi:glycosyltransferase involved in cell wall biosynthesis
MSKTSIDVSVIIITWNQSALVTKVINAALAQQTTAFYEVIVVDNNSTDDTWERVEAYGPRVEYVFEPKQGTGIARNAGLEVAAGEIIAFLDGDSIPRPTWLESLVEAFRTHPDAWSVGGNTYYPFFTVPSNATFRAPWTEIRGGNMAFRASTIDRVGRFDPRTGFFGHDRSLRGLPYGEDWDMAKRIAEAGGTFYYCGNAVVDHVDTWTKRDIRRIWMEAGRAEARERGPLSIAKTIRESSIFLKEVIKFAGYCVRGERLRTFQYEISLRKRAAYLWHGVMARNSLAQKSNHERSDQSRDHNTKG